MVEPASERLQWAAEVVDAAPDDRILEIGCGNGALVALLCARMQTGTVTAIDRSEKMIEAALRRNRQYVIEGKARFLAEEVADSQFGLGSFTKIVAFNVGAFWKTEAPELKRIKTWLAPHGTIYLFCQPPTEESEQDSVERLRRRLEEEGFTVCPTLYREMKPARAICVRTEPVG
jgi:cyclopropane fatty-acyl-phospholipid synthase-like methyltransferase